jgi:hypothetical protein
MANEKAKGVTIKPKIDDKPGNYKILNRKGRQGWQEIGDPHVYEGSERKQELDPETLEPIKVKKPEDIDSAPTDHIARKARRQQLEVEKRSDLFKKSGIKFDVHLKKADLIEQILAKEGY